MGGDIPKQFIFLENRPVLMHTIQAFYDYDANIGIVLVLSHEQTTYWENLCTEYDFSIPHQIVAGGETRFHSVRNGLQLINKQLDDNDKTNVLIGVHDGVRPLVDKSLIAAVYEQADLKGAAYPVIPVIDSMRKLKNDSTHTASYLAPSVPVDRSEYLLVQTPQVFKANLLIEAYKQEYKPEFTDDVSVVEASGSRYPAMVEGSRENIKITTPVDLIIAQALMKCRI
jgi:2-C-methyl-D-erythritol 4-phosphate cytidylyltransferase